MSGSAPIAEHAPEATASKTPRPSISPKHRSSRSKFPNYEQVRPRIKEMSRYQPMAVATAAMKRGTDDAARELTVLSSAIDPVLAQLKRACTIVVHDPAVHLKGELRFLAGRPPDRPLHGLIDCRIFEAVLEIARTDAASPRTKRFFVSADSDFDHPDLHAELAQRGFKLREDIGAVYGELR